MVLCGPKRMSNEQRIKVVDYEVLRIGPYGVKGLRDTKYIHLVC